MLTTIKWYSSEKSFGFAKPDGDPNAKDVFIYSSELQKSKIHTLREGDRVELDIIIGKNGREQGTNLRLM